MKLHLGHMAAFAGIFVQPLYNRPVIYSKESKTVRWGKVVDFSLRQICFNGVFRDGCLNRWLFTSVHEARRIITNWREEYNHERPHGVLDGLAPRAFAAQCSH